MVDISSNLGEIIFAIIAFIIMGIIIINCSVSSEDIKNDVASKYSRYQTKYIDYNVSVDNVRGMQSLGKNQVSWMAMYSSVIIISILLYFRYTGLI